MLDDSKPYALTRFAGLLTLVSRDPSPVRGLVLLVLMMVAAPLPGAAQVLGTPVARPETPQEDSAAVARTVDAYHRALAAGDSAIVTHLLAADAVILESGGLETRAEYLSHHLPGDIAFARAGARQRGPIRVVVRGDVAWATSTSTTRGEYRSRPVDSVGVELMVLVRTEEGWQISGIHWSSRNRPS